jgi:hypothetical protein
MWWDTLYKSAVSPQQDAEWRSSRRRSPSQMRLVVTIDDPCKKQTEEKREGEDGEVDCGHTEIRV